MKQRTFYVRCWECDGHGQSGRFHGPNLHISFECPTCRGTGPKVMRRHK